MSPSLRLPTLAFAALSIVLNLAVLACAARTRHLFNSQQSSNEWFLPIWPNHFDLRGLQTLIGTSTTILVLNAVSVIALVVPNLPATITTLAASFLTALVSLVALILPPVLNNQSPRRDTLQTWTCQWTRTTVFSGQQPPSQFGTICQETRFAFFTTIPIFILQLCLLGTAGMALRASRRSNGSSKGTRALSSADGYDLDRKEHELGNFGDLKGSPKSTVTESARILPERRQG